MISSKSYLKIKIRILKIWVAIATCSLRKAAAFTEKLQMIFSAKCNVTFVVDVFVSFEE